MTHQRTAFVATCSIALLVCGAPAHAQAPQANDVEYTGSYAMLLNAMLHWNALDVNRSRASGERGRR